MFLIITLLNATLLIIGFSVCSIVAGFFIGSTYRKRVAEAKIGSAESEAEKIINQGKASAEASKKELLLEAKEENIKAKAEIEKETKERRAELQKTEKRLLQKEDNLDRKYETLEKKEAQLTQKSENLDNENLKLQELLEKATVELERISGLSSDQAKELLLSNIEEEVKVESAIMIKDMEQKAKLEADKKAKEIIVSAIQRCDVDHSSETTVSVVNLPSDEMKGRIIGREGRNIRSLESLTGIDLIIDDTPEAVILSSFDPLRREVARLALEKLIVDGRVHPARIEEMVKKSEKELENLMREEGESATFDLGVHDINPELIKLLGKLKFRTSYGQSVLNHSIEVAHLTGLMAAELGVDVTLAKRAGLLHDIGKAVNHDVGGSHVSVGVTLCKKYKEPETVINSVESHHGDVEPTSIISILVGVADAISASRPGARRETLESYIQRLQKLEGIADSFKGVEKSFAIQAGRELRIIIIPEEVNDTEMVLLSREIAKRIEAELQYPGQIKLNLVRETRAIEFAK